MDLSEKDMMVSQDKSASSRSHAIRATTETEARTFQLFPRSGEARHEIPDRFHFFFWDI